MLAVIAVRTSSSAECNSDHKADIGGGSVKNGTRNSLARIPLRWMIRQLFQLEIGILFHRNMFPKIGMDPATLYPVSEAKRPRPPPLYQAPHAPSPPGTPKSMIKAQVLPPPEVVTDDPTMIVYSDGGKFVNEELEDLADATSPMYDQLSLARVWWILEVIPQMLHYQDDKSDNLVDEYTCVISCFVYYHANFDERVNMGRGRHIQRQIKDGVKIHRSVKIRMEAENLKGGKYWPKAKLKVEPKWVD